MALWGSLGTIHEAMTLWLCNQTMNIILDQVGSWQVMDLFECCYFHGSLFSLITETFTNEISVDSILPSGPRLIAICYVTIEIFCTCVTSNPDKLWGR